MQKVTWRGAGLCTYVPSVRGGVRVGVSPDGIFFPALSVILFDCGMRASLESWLTDRGLQQIASWSASRREIQDWRAFFFFFFKLVSSVLFIFFLLENRDTPMHHSHSVRSLDWAETRCSRCRALQNLIHFCPHLKSMYLLLYENLSVLYRIKLSMSTSLVQFVCLTQ